MGGDQERVGATADPALPGAVEATHRLERTPRQGIETPVAPDLVVGERRRDPSAGGLDDDRHEMVEPFPEGTPNVTTWLYPRHGHTLVVTEAMPKAVEWLLGQRRKE